jgi:hypothetical protein
MVEADGIATVVDFAGIPRGIFAGVGVNRVIAATGCRTFESRHQLAV